MIIACISCDADINAQSVRKTGLSTCVTKPYTFETPTMFLLNALCCSSLVETTNAEGRFAYRARGERL